MLNYSVAELRSDKKPLAKYTVRTMGKSGKERQLLLVQRQKRTPVVWR